MYKCQAIAGEIRAVYVTVPNDIVFIRCEYIRDGVLELLARKTLRKCDAISYNSSACSVK